MTRTFSIDAPDQQRLKIARTEIEAVLKKHDLAGVCVLHTPGMTEYFYDIRPSYSCVWIDDRAQAMRVRSKLADYGGDAKQQHQHQAATANMLAAFADELTSAALMFAACARAVDTSTHAEHTEGTFVPDPAEGKLQ